MSSHQKIEKIRKTTRIAARVLRVFQILFVLAVAVALGCLAMVRSGKILIPADVQESLEVVATIGGKDATQFSGGVVIFAVVCVLAKAGLYLAIMENLRRMMRDIASNGTPFERVQVVRMKRIAVMVFVGSFVNFLSIQANEWLVAAMVWLLAMVFDYGCELQQESDETL